MHMLTIYPFGDMLKSARLVFRSQHVAEAIQQNLSIRGYSARLSQVAEHPDRDSIESTLAAAYLKIGVEPIVPSSLEDFR